MAIWDPFKSLHQANPSNTNSTYYTRFCYVVGGAISPILANIYLHYALDLWLHQWRKRHAIGEVYIVRYADDFIIGLQYQSDGYRLKQA